MRGSRRRQVLQAAMSVLLLAAVIWYAKNNVTSLSGVWARVTAMTTMQIAVLLVATAWNLMTYWIVTVCATPGLTLSQAMVQTETTTAVSDVVPAGGAVAVGLTYAMFGSWGFSKSRTSLSVVVSGIWNNFAKLGMPIAAFAILAVSGSAGGGRIVAGGVGFAALIAAIVVFAAILRSQDFAARVGITTGRWMSALRRLVKRGPVQGWDLAVVKFRARVIGLVRARWMALTFWTLVGHLSLYAVLLIAVRDVGIPNSRVGWAEILAVFAFARLATAIPLTPGGVGIVELALIGGLSAAGGGHTRVVAAVLVYRVLTYVIQIPFGLCTYVYWRRNKSWLNSAPPLDPKFTAESFESYVPHPVTTSAVHHRSAEVPAMTARPVRWTRVRYLEVAGIALAVVLLCGLAAHGGQMGGAEEHVFRWINGLPGWLYRPMWLFEQLGNLLVAFALAILAAIVLRRPRLAVAACAAVGLKLAFEWIVKQLVARQRPGALLDHVVRRGNVPAHGLSFVSGHAVITAAVAMIMTPLLRGRWRVVPWILVGLTGFARVYVGAHSPLDVVGGVGLGVLIGSLLNVILAPRDEEDLPVEPSGTPPDTDQSRELAASVR